MFCPYVVTFHCTAGLVRVELPTILYFTGKECTVLSSHGVALGKSLDSVWMVILCVFTKVKQINKILSLLKNLIFSFGPTNNPKHGRRGALTCTFKVKYQVESVKFCLFPPVFPAGSHMPKLCSNLKRLRSVLCRHLDKGEWSIGPAPAIDAEAAGSGLYSEVQTGVINSQGQELRGAVQLVILIYIVIWSLVHYTS